MSEPNTSDPRNRSESLDAHLSALAKAECRYVVYYFQRTTDDVASLGDLAAFVAANGGRTTGGSNDRIRTRLHHRTLPKLDDFGVVDYDNDGSVRYHGSPGLEELAAIAAREEWQGT